MQALVTFAQADPFTFNVALTVMLWSLDQIHDTIRWWWRNR